MKRRLFNLAAAAVSLLVCAAAAEMAARVVLSEDDYFRLIPAKEPGLSAHWTDHPFLPFIGQPNADYYVAGVDRGSVVRAHAVNNSHGFRTHEWDDPRNAEDLVVACFGGSTTWGAIAQTNAEAWPELLETKLAQRYPGRRVRVYNFGTQNATTAYSLVALALFGVHLKPDVIVVYHGFNDFGPALAADFRTDYSHFYRDLNLAGAWHGVAASLPRWALASYAVAWAAGRFDESLHAGALSFYIQREFRPDPQASGVREHAIPALLRNWEHLATMNAVAEGAGARALFSTFQFYDGDVEQRKWVNDSLRMFFADRGLPYVDQDALIPDRDRSIQFDECHLTADGRERIAENFYRRIVKDLVASER